MAEPLFHVEQPVDPFEATILVQNLLHGQHGNFTIKIHPEWARKGSARFVELAREHFYDGCRFFRTIRHFVAQFGISGSPATQKQWREKFIRDDRRAVSNTRGTISFANAGPDTRSTQLFINFKDNTALDALGFAPFAEVVRGMEVVDAIYAGYGEGAPNGIGPSQARIDSEGNPYLERSFPHLTWIQGIEFGPGATDDSLNHVIAQGREHRHYLTWLGEAVQFVYSLGPWGQVAFFSVIVVILGTLLVLWTLGVFSNCRCRAPKTDARARGLQNGGMSPVRHPSAEMIGRSGPDSGRKRGRTPQGME